jgi:hypothetical protein
MEVPIAAAKHICLTAQCRLYNKYVIPVADGSTDQRFEGNDLRCIAQPSREVIDGFLTLSVNKQQAGIAKHSRGFKKYLVGKNQSVAAGKNC